MNKQLTNWTEYAMVYDSLNQLESYKLLIREILSQIKKLNLRKANVIDLGCGTGNLTIQIAKSYHDYSVLGIDSNEEMIKIANKKKGNLSNVTFKVTNLLCDEISGYYDIAVMNNVLYIVKEKVYLLKKIGRLLKPNGIFILSDCLSQEESNYFHFLLEQFKSVKSVVEFLKNLGNFLKIFKINKVIDKDFVRLNSKQMHEIIDQANFRIIFEKRVYAKQNILFVLRKDEI